MVTLAKRATPAQVRILKIVEGAVLNAYDAHRTPRDTWLARSVAKRAAGTLSAQWPEVLAVNSRLPAKGTSIPARCRACERRGHLIRLSARREHATFVTGNVKGSNHSARREPPQLLRRLPLLLLWDKIKREMWHIKRLEDTAKIQAHIYLLKMINDLHHEIIDAEQT